MNTAPYPTALIPDAQFAPPPPAAKRWQGLQWPLALGLSAGLAFGAAYVLAHRQAPRPHLASVAGAQPATTATDTPRAATPTAATSAVQATQSPASARIHGDVAPAAPDVVSVAAQTPPQPTEPAPSAGDAAPGASSKPRGHHRSSARRVATVTRPADEPDVGF